MVRGYSKAMTKLQLRILELLAGYGLFFIAFDGYHDNRIRWAAMIVCVVIYALTNYYQGKLAQREKYRRGL
jgi:hypothetical protein